MRAALQTFFSAVLLASCRIETAAPVQATSCASSTPSGDVWIYTSMYRHVLDSLDPLLRQQLPSVNVRWFQAGSEKVLNRLEAELASGGTQADLLATSDPFLYARLKHEGRWAPYVSPHSLRTPRELVDEDGHYAALRLSTMVLVHRQGMTAPPRSFAELTLPRFRGEVAFADPLTSGTAFTWAVFMEEAYTKDWFQALRNNDARIAGGNAAVVQKLDGSEASVGVLLLENALAAKAKGSAIEIVWPQDGAVLIPGFVGVFQSSRNPTAARAVADALLSPQAQAIIVGQGDMHAVDPRMGGPRTERALPDLLKSSRPWTQAIWERGTAHATELKTAFSGAFAQ